MLEAHWSAIRALNTKRHNHHVQCEKGQLTEDLINPRFLHNSQASVEVKLSADWYYNHVPIDSLLEIDGHFICKVIIPIVKNEPKVDVQIYSLPVPTWDGNYLQVYHSVEVAVRQDGDLLFPQHCLGQGMQCWTDNTVNVLKVSFLDMRRNRKSVKSPIQRLFTKPD